MLRCPGSWAAKPDSFLNALFVFFRVVFANFYDVNVHGIRIMGFGGSGEGLI